MTKTYNKQAFEIIEKSAEEDGIQSNLPGLSPEKEEEIPKEPKKPGFEEFVSQTKQKEKEREKILEEEPIKTVIKEKEDIQKILPPGGIEYPTKLTDVDYKTIKQEIKSCPICGHKQKNLNTLKDCHFCQQIYKNILDEIIRYIKETYHVSQSRAKKYLEEYHRLNKENKSFIFQKRKGGRHIKLEIPFEEIFSKVEIPEGPEKELLSKDSIKNIFELFFRFSSDPNFSIEEEISEDILEKDKTLEQYKEKVKKYAPSSPQFVQCPVCQSQFDPIIKQKDRYLFIEDCPKCLKTFERIVENFKDLYRINHKAIEKKQITKENLINQAINKVDQKSKFNKEMIKKIFQLRGGLRFPKIYETLKNIVEEHNVPIEEVIKNVAKETKYSPELLEQIWKGQGKSILLYSELENRPEAGIKSRVENALKMNLNVQRDDQGDIIYDRQKLPIPLKKDRYFTSEQLAKKLNWTPELLVNELEKAGKDFLPYGGMSREKKPYVEPEEDLSPKEVELNKLRIGLKSMQALQPENPELYRLPAQIKNLKQEIFLKKNKLQNLQTELPNLLNSKPKKENIAKVKEEAIQMKKQIDGLKATIPMKEQKLKEIQKRLSAIQTPKDLEISKIKEKMDKLTEEIEIEKKLHPKEKQTRSQKSHLNIWDYEMIKDVIEEREKDVEEIIKPAQKIKNLGYRIQKKEKAIDVLKEDMRLANQGFKQRLKHLNPELKEKFLNLKKLLNVQKQVEEKKIPLKKLKDMEKKLGQTLYQLQKDVGKQFEKMEEQYNKTKAAVEINKEKVEELQQEKEQMLADFIDATSAMGYKWYDTRGKKDFNLEQAISLAEETLKYFNATEYSEDEE